ncbi:MAG TPA: tRNA (adenosine(37)-N6)-dimethylallyltransferase MiaA [bacterium]
MSDVSRGEAPAMADLQRLVAVVGATASGKSGLALALAEALGGEIVNSDSMQVYWGFDVGTAKPGAAERARVPHHLIDVAAPDEVYSAGRYVAEARAAIADIVARERVPILCGGTGLYYRALLFGLAPIPSVPGAVQARVEARVAASGSAAAHAQLAQVDAAAAAAIHPNDPLRVARALGVYEGTGRPLSDYRRAQPFRPAPAAVLAVGLRWERAALYARIDRRVREMLAAGWIEEVQGLLARGYGPELKPMQAIGYREIAQWLGAGGPREELEALAGRIAQRTRQYAKRQLTWFRQHAEVRWVEPGAREAVIEAARNFLLPPRERR